MADSTAAIRSANREGGDRAGELVVLGVAEGLITDVRRLQLGPAGGLSGGERATQFGQLEQVGLRVGGRKQTLADARARRAERLADSATRVLQTACSTLRNRRETANSTATVTSRTAATVTPMPTVVASIGNP
jgi:hypothetical protein